MTSSVSELADLLDAPVAGDRERAWSVFVDRYSGILLHAVRQPRMAYDRIMDRYTFVLEQLREGDYKRLRAYQPHQGTQFTTWLVVVAQRLAVDHHRKVYGRPTGGDPDTGTIESRRRLVDLLGEMMDLTSIEGSAGSNPIDTLASDERAAALSSSLEGLEPRDRMMLALRFEDNASARQIAESMRFSSQFHVYRRLQKVLAALKVNLEARGIDAAE